MTGEVTVPLLPCADIDEISEFYRMLGFEQTYRQVRPNPFIMVKREDIGLGFFSMPGFNPADSYGTCVVAVPDIVTLFDSFAAGMRATHGRLLVAGIPRMTRPRKRKNADNLAGFAVVDPGGNWIRFSPSSATTPPDVSGDAPTKLRTAVDNAVVLADSKGDDRQAAKIMEGALARLQSTAAPVDLVDALAFGAELAMRMGDRLTAAMLLDQLRAIELSATERLTVADSLSTTVELHRILDATDEPPDGT